MLLSEGAALGFLAAGVVPEGVDDDLLLGFPLVGLGELLFGKLGAGFGGVGALPQRPGDQQHEHQDGSDTAGLDTWTEEKNGARDPEKHGKE